MLREEKMKRLVGVGTLLGLLFVALFTMSAAFAADTRGITGDTVRIGLIADTTGPVANLGRFLKMGCEDYFNFVNEKGGINGRKISLIHEDDQYQIPKALAAFEKLVFKDEVLSILHCGGTPQVMALMPAIAKERVPIIPPGQYEKMYNPYQRYIFVFGSTYADQAACAIDYMMNDLKAKKPKVGIVYMENEVGRQGLDACRERLAKYGLKPAAELELSLKSVDASSQVMSLKKVNADYVILFELPPAVINFLKTAQKSSYYPTYLSYTWCADDSILKATGDAAKNGYYAASIFGTWHDNSPGANEMRAIAEKYGHGSPKLPSLYIQGVADAMMTVEGIKRAGRDITVEKYVDALETMKDYDCGGLLSPMTYTPKAHPPSPYSKILKADVEKGVFVSGSGWIKPRNLK
jgi:branched-chain amino acid transport system substrate-binding protein